MLRWDSWVLSRCPGFVASLNGHDTGGAMKVESSQSLTLVHLTAQRSGSMRFEHVYPNCGGIIRNVHASYKPACREMLSL